MIRNLLNWLGRPQSVNTATRTMIDLDQVVQLASSKQMREIQYDTFVRMEQSSNMNLDVFRHLAELDSTDYSSVRTVLGAYASLAQPRSYLEIGTRRGHSLCMVVRCTGQPLDVFSFDLWLENYAGESNPGQELIRAELAKFNFQGTISFFDGDSKQTVPAFFANQGQPQMIDLIFVDGDHSDEGARADLLNVIDHIAPGGLLVFDDITHPQHRSLLGVWHSIVDNRPDFVTRENTVHEYGWAIAQRIAPDSQ